MVTVCAWCQRYMGSKEPLHDPAVSHGICPLCVERQSMADTPVLVVSPARAATIPLLQSLLGGTPDVAIVVDRRSGERRNGNGRANGNGHERVRDHGAWSGYACVALPPADRRTSDRRRRPALYLV